MSDSEKTPDGPDRSVWEEARDLIKRLETSSVHRLRIKSGNSSIEIERGLPAAAGAPVALSTQVAAAIEDGAAAAEPDNRHKIVAPLVGTFYRAPQPGAKPFVEEGDVVDEGQTVGIVEAMKLMNHVNADQGGRVAEIVAADGEWVEFEQALMYLVPVDE